MAAARYGGGYGAIMKPTVDVKRVVRLVQPTHQALDQPPNAEQKI